MKNKITATKHERKLAADALLVSKTDTKGIITYCNQEFITLSGYSETQLLGQPQSIVRHPDMPRVIFSLLWETLHSSREFNAYFKNITLDGSFYWVFANITPCYSSAGKLLGYYCVHRAPDAEKITYVEQLYSELLIIESEQNSEEAIAASRYKLDGVLNGQEKGYDEFILTI